jgi:predicted TIM-barrel fold metal-dependent hydrolase
MKPIDAPPVLSRRAFGIAAAGSLATSAFARQAEPRDYVDAHVHVWTPDVQRYPIDSGYSVEDMVPKSFTPDELFTVSRPSGVGKIVLIQMSFYNFDNRYMLDAIAKYPENFSGVGIVDHRQATVGDAMLQLAEGGVRGFRIHSRGDADAWVDHEGMAKLWETAREKGLAVCPLINPADIRYVDALCRKFPGTTVVVDHFARVGITGDIVPSELTALCDLAKHENLYVKTSAFYALGRKRPPYTDLLPMIRRVVDAFGPERLMWASDCPYQVQGIHDYDSSIALIRDRADFLSAADKQWMLKKTAEKVFFERS